MATPYVFKTETEVTSTQDLARDAYHDVPVVWMASRQTAGRGRSGRPWLTADEAVAVSVAFRPRWPTAYWPALSLVAGLSALTVLDEHGVADAGLKWPNDIVSERGKFGGILAEVSGDVAVLGLGLNLYWPAAPDGMAGLWSTPPAEGFREVLARHFASEFLNRCGNDASSWGLEEYRIRCRTIGREILWNPHGTGTAVDIAADGGLIVDADGETRVLRSGEVWEIRDHA